MRAICKAISITGLIMIGVVICPEVVHSQSVWLPHYDEPTLSLDILKAKLEQEGTKFLSTVWFLSARTPVSDNVTLLAELPFVHFDRDEPDYCWNGCYTGIEYEPETMLGNPYIGLEVYSRGSGWYGQFGVRLPAAPDDKENAAWYGTLTDLDRFEAFYPDMITVNGKFGGRIHGKDDYVVDLFAGPSFVFTTEQNIDDEVFIDYGALVWLKTEVVRIGGGLTGRLLATSDGGNFGEITIHQFGFAANLGSGRFQPGAYLRVPLDDDLSRAGLDYVWGINLLLRLR